VGETLGDYITAGAHLQFVIADHAGRSQGLIDISGFQKAGPFCLLSMLSIDGPDAGQTIRLKFNPNGNRVGLSRILTALRRAGLFGNP